MFYGNIPMTRDTMDKLNIVSLCILHIYHDTAIVVNESIMIDHRHWVINIIIHCNIMITIINSNSSSSSMNMFHDIIIKT